MYPLRFSRKSTTSSSVPMLSRGGEPVLQAAVENRLVEAVDLLRPEHGVGLEVGKGQGALAAQRVAPSHEHPGHDHSDLHAGAVRGVKLADREQGVEGSGAKARQRALPNGDGEMGLHPKRVRDEARDDAADELVLRERRGDEREPEVLSGRRALPRHHRLLDGIEALDGLERRLEEHAPELGEAHPPSRTNKEAAADLLLEFVNRLRDCLNGDALLLCGCGEVSSAGRTAEKHELSDVHVATPVEVLCSSLV